MKDYKLITETLSHAEAVFFVGIGGVSMSSLAVISAEAGFRVIGSDRTRTPVTDRLEERGIKVFHTHDASNIDGCNALVYTAAVHDDNPELCAARARGVPCFTRAEYLGWIMCRYERRIGVSGSHGKSTVTSMISLIFMDSGADPTVVSGAELSDMGGAYRIGDSKYFVFEACEYTDSFLSFCPTTAVVLNIELDHTDYFSSLGQIISSFGKYISIADTAVLNYDDENVRVASSGFEGRAVSFAVDGDADFTAENITFGEDGCASFDFMQGSSRICRIGLSVPGRHNVTDALAAATAAFVNGATGEDIARGLEQFRGAKRRFELRGCRNGAEFYDDYAHHPTEIRATLAAARKPGKRIVCVFQPHTYTRTYRFFEAFAGSFGDADEVIVTDIYAARETDDCGISSKMLAEHIGGAKYIPTLAEVADYLRGHTGEGDRVLLLGAGDICNIWDMVNRD